jgi:hypothetical protein
VPVWSLPAWHRQFCLSNDGDHLVIGPEGLSLLPLETKLSDPLLVFMNRKAVVRVVAVGELFPDLSSLRRTASHLEWGRVIGISPRDQLIVELVGGRRVEYSMATGRLVAGSTTAEDPSRWTGTSGGLHVTISDKTVVVSDSNGTREIPLNVSSESKSEGSDVESYSDRYTPLSLVGPYLSLAREYSASLSGAAHVQSVREFVTLDLRNPNGSASSSRASGPQAPIALTRWFTEEQLVSVLKKDSFVAKQLKLPRPGLDSLKALASAFDILNNCRFSLGDGSMTNFAFYELKAHGQVAVRVRLVNSCISDDENNQLGLLLPVPHELETDLKAAAPGRQGFLMKDSRKLFARGQP